MSEFDYKLLDDIIHSRIRLAIMSVLITVKEADFNFLKAQIKATDGNLSVHLKKLEDAEYINVRKEFIGKKPVTTCSLSKKGKIAFEKYIERLESLIKR